MRWLLLVLVPAALGSGLGCESERRPLGPPVPVSSDPEGGDLKEGAVVVAVESTGRYRTYKIIEINWFPQPVGAELVMIAYHETADSFAQAAARWAKGEMTVAVAKTRVRKHRFMTRDYRVISNEPVTDQDLEVRQQNPDKPK